MPMCLTSYVFMRIALYAGHDRVLLAVLVLPVTKNHHGVMFNGTATTEFSTLALHDALPISTSK